MKFCVDKPYPEVQVERPNLDYAKALLFAYAGNVSEETAVHQYLYQSFVLDEKLSNILEQIGIVEMHHVEILANIIKKLGLDPKYRTFCFDKEIYWDASFVPYPITITSMLEQNIKSETEAIENYRRLISYIKDPYIQNSLERIIEDEQLHLSIFQNLLENTKKEF